MFRRVRRESPASYLKVCAVLVPREMQIEHSGGVKAMTTDQIERSIEYIKEQLAKREAGANAKVIEGTIEPQRTRKPRRQKPLAERVFAQHERDMKDKAQSEQDDTER